MIRTNIYLTQDQYEAVQTEAQSEGKPAAQVIRQALDAYLQKPSVARQRMRTLAGRAGRLAKPMGWDQMREIAWEDATSSTPQS